MVKSINVIIFFFSFGTGVLFGTYFICVLIVLTVCTLFLPETKVNHVTKSSSRVKIYYVMTKYKSTIDLLGTCFFPIATFKLIKFEEAKRFGL